MWPVTASRTVDDNAWIEVVLVTVDRHTVVTSVGSRRPRVLTSTRPAPHSGMPPARGERTASRMLRGAAGGQFPTRKRTKPLASAPASCRTLATVFFGSLANGCSSRTFSLK